MRRRNSESDERSDGMMLNRRSLSKTSSSIKLLRGNLRVIFQRFGEHAHSGADQVPDGLDQNAGFAGLLRLNQAAR